MTLPAVGAAPDQSVRGRVLEAAIDLFARQGYEQTSVSQVVIAAGVAKGGFYHHFASKEDLLYEVYGDLIARQLVAMDAILARQLPAAETLRLLVVDLVVSTAQSGQQALVFRREMHRLGDDRAEQYRRLRRRYHDTVRRLIRDGQAAGDFARTATPDTVAFTIFGVVNELPLWYREGGRTKPAQLGSEIADFVLAGLQVRDR